MIDGNPYFRWIENYVAEDFCEAVEVGRRLLEDHAVRLSPERVEEVVEIFSEAIAGRADGFGLGGDEVGYAAYHENCRSPDLAPVIFAGR